MAISKFEIETTFSTGKEGFDPEREAYERKLRNARDDAHKKGFREGHAQALGEIEAASSKTLGHVQKALSDLFGVRNEMEKKLENEAIQLAFLTSKKIVANLIKKYPYDEIELLIQNSINSGYNEPKIVIRVSDKLHEIINSQISDMVNKSGFHGEVAILADASLSQHDCSVEWPNGGVSRNIAEIEKQIKTKIENYINGPLEAVVAKTISENFADEPERVEESLLVEENKDIKDITETVKDESPDNVTDETAEETDKE